MPRWKTPGTYHSFLASAVPSPLRRCDGGSGALLSVLIAASGCERPEAGSTQFARGAEATGPLIDPRAAAHHFGPVVSRSGRKLEHAYPLRNATARDVVIRDIINRKTCCGALRVGKTLLHPGEATEIVVTLLVGGKFGAVDHEAEVITDPPPARDLVLRTSADAIPELRIEGDSSAPTVPIGAREPRRLEFRVFAAGTEAEPPPDLDRLQLRSTVEVAWTGPKQPGPEVDGLTVASRRFVVTLAANGPPGERRVQVDLLDGERALFRQSVTWEVASAIVSSPRTVVFQHDRLKTRVLLRVGDGRPFRVERVECESEDVKGRAAEPGPALVHVVEIEASPSPARGRGAVIVVTDHPAQVRVELPYVVLD